MARLSSLQLFHFFNGLSVEEQEIRDKPVELLLSELDALVTLPSAGEVKKAKNYDVIKLHKRDANIVRFIVPYSVIKQYIKIDTGYSSWKKLNRDLINKDGFFDDDISRLGIPLTSGLELMTYIIFNKENSDVKRNGSIKDKWKSIIRTIYNNNFGTSQTIYYLERISLYAKKFGVKYDVNWKYFVDPTYWGHRYREINWFETTRREAIMDWFVVPSSIEEGHYYNEFMVKFDAAVDLYFSKFNFVRAKTKIRSVNEFLYDPGSWATSGSTPGKNRPHNLYDFIPRRDLKNSKWILGLNDFDKLLDVMLDEKSEQLNVNDKEEAGKVRIFVSAGVTSYLKQAYIGEVLNEGFSGSQEQTIFWTKQQRFKKWEEVLSKLLEGWNLPADLAKFDQKAVSRRMLISIFTKIKNMFAGDNDFKEYAFVAEKNLKQYLNKPFTIDNGERINMEKGMASGWYWTAFLDSIISWCFSQILITEYNFNMTQGDDILSQLIAKEQFVRFWWLVKRYNVEINPKKFYLDNKRAEFLRLSFEKDGIFGYPSRAIGSLLWRKPWNEDIKTLREKLEASLSSWKRLLIRSGIYSVIGWMKLDFEGIVKNKDLRLLQISRFDGGLGIDVGKDQYLTVDFDTEFKDIKNNFGEFNFSNTCFKYAVEPVNYLQDKLIIKMLEKEDIKYNVIGNIGFRSMNIDLSGGFRLIKNEYKNKTLFDSELLYLVSIRDYDKYIKVKYYGETVITLERIKTLISKKLYLDLILSKKIFKQDTTFKNSEILMSQISEKCENILISNILLGKIRTYNQIRIANMLLNRFSSMFQAQINPKGYRFCD